MKNNTKQKLKLFAELKNWQATHPSDMERFYEFIIKAYKNKDTEISKDEFLEVINPIYEMNENELDRWIIKFECGIELLKVYNKKFVKNFDLNKTTCENINTSEQSLYGSSHQLQQINLKDLEDCWKNKWASFNGWTNERQLYRYLYTTFRLFYYSFKQLNDNKTVSEKSENDYKFDYYIHCIGGNLCGVYNFGKKCIDLIKELKEDNELNDDEKFFIGQFSETRNKIIEHNFNPRNFSYKIDPNFWKSVDTNSYLNIKFHGDTENEYERRIDYYQDYFKLENIFSKIIKTWE